MQPATVSANPTRRATPRRVLVPLQIEPRALSRGSHVHALRGTTMGTSWSVQLVCSAQPALVTIERTIQRELDLVVAQMSTWDPASDLMRFNGAPPGTWHTMPAELFEVLACAHAVARDSDGAFDPCAGALVNAWGFGPGGGFRDTAFQRPDSAQIDAARAAGGWQRLQLDAQRQRAVQPGGLQLDLSAIAKGYAVDRVALALQRECGVHHLLVEIGGELRGHGAKPDGQPWWVQLASPRNDGAPETWVALHDVCVATSGDDERWFLRDGLRHPHTIDPRIGHPIQHGVCAVTVLHASCMWADALSTALTVLGPDVGLAWADTRGVVALWVTRRSDGGFDEVLTRACAALAD